MKILSIQNRNQNQNNRPIAFGDLKSVIAGEAIRDGEHYIALALKATGKDLEDLRAVLKHFPYPQQKDVLHISATGHYYEAEQDSFDRYNMFVNGKGFSWSDNIFEMFENPEKIDGLKNIKDKVYALLERLFGNEKFEMPKKKSDERSKMLRILAPQGQLQESKIAGNQKEVGNIAGVLAAIINKVDNT